MNEDAAQSAVDGLRTQSDQSRSIGWEVTQMSICWNRDFKRSLNAATNAQALGNVRDIDKDSHKFVPIHLAAVRPFAANRLALRRNNSKPFLQLVKRCRHKLLWCRLAVIEPQWEQYLVPTEFFAHKLPALRR